MTPETKAWIEEVKKETDYAINEGDTKCAYQILRYDIPKAIQIIESQEKEIERAIVHLNKVIEDEESRPGAWGPDVTCVRYIKTAKDILEAL